MQYAVEEALVYAGRKTAVESSVIESQELLLASAKGYFLYALGDNEVIDNYVYGGKWGILLWESKFEEEQICLRANYEMRLPVDIWGIGSIWLYNQNVFNKWNGDMLSSNEETGNYVYITQNGTVYHRTPSCRILDINIREVEVSQIETERGKDGQKYYPCSRCGEENVLDNTVYCTDYGTLYHAQISCSALKRTIHKVKLEEVGERNPCSFCTSSCRDS